MLRSELFRLRRTRAVFILVAILAAAVVAGYGAAWCLLRIRPAGLSAHDIADLRNYLQVGSTRAFGLEIVQILGTLLVILLTAAAIGSEYHWGTIRTILPRAQSRSVFLTAKLIISVCFAAILVSLGFLVALIASISASLLEGWHLSFGANGGQRTIESLIRTGYVMLPFVALAFAVTIWLRSTAAGSGIALAIFFLEPPLTRLIERVGGPLRHLSDLLLSGNVSAITHLNDLGTNLNGASRNLPNPWLAAAILALYSALFVSLGYWRFQTRDVTAS